jgi:autotransporter-associated beta strand protein
MRSFRSSKQAETQPPKAVRKRKISRRPALLPNFDTLEIRLTPTVRTWSGIDGNLWSDSLNWVGNVAPSAGDDLVFPSSAVTNFTVANDFTAGTNFNSITIQSSAYKLIGNSVDLSGSIVTTYTSGTAIDNVPVTLHAAGFNIAGGGQLDLGGALSGSGGLTISGGGTVAMTGASANSYTGLTSLDQGTLLLDRVGSTAIPGDLTIGDAVDTALVQDLSANQIADTSNVTLNSSGSLDLNGNDDHVGSLTFNGTRVTTETGVLTLARDITSNSSSSMSSISGNLALTAGNHNVTVADPVAGAVDLRISAAISGSGGLTKAGLGRLDVTGNNSYTGATLINSGIVSISDSNALGDTATGTTVASGAELDISGNITVGEALTVSGTGTSGAGAIVNMSGTNSLTGPITLAADSTIGVSAGQLTLSGVIGDGGNGFGLTEVGGNTLVLGGSAANTYTGTTTVPSGTLELSDSAGVAIPGNLVIGDGVHTALVQETAANQIADTATVTISSTGTLDLNGNSDTIGSLDLTGSSVSTGAATLTLTGGVTTHASSQTATISGNLGLAAGAHAFNVPSGTTPSGIDLNIPAIVSGAGAITESGGGTMDLSGDNSYAGGTSVTAGILEISGNTALGGTAVGTTVSSGASLEVSGGISVASQPITLNGTGVGGNGALRNLSGSNALNGVITLGSDSTIGADAGNLSLGGVIADGGNNHGITKVGSGTLTLGGSAANTYTGTTNVVAGTLELSDTGGVSVPGNLIVGNGTNNVLVQATQTNQLTSTSAVTVNSSGTLDFAGNDDQMTSLTVVDGSVTIGGAFVNVYGPVALTAGSIATAPNGNLIVHGNITSNAASTTATISGNLDLAAATRTITVASGTTANGIDLDISATIADGGFIKSGSGTLQLDGANTFSGGVTDSAGVIIANNSTALGSAAATIASGASLDLTGGITVANNLSVAGTGGSAQGAVVSTGAVNNAESGNITLTGATTLGAGANSTLTLSGLIDDGGNGYALTVSNATSGTTVFSGSNTYKGTTTVAGGTLEVISNHALGSNSTGASVNSGATLELAGSITTDAIPLTVSGAGGGGNGVLLNLSGNNNYSGAITLGSNVTVGVTAGSLDLSGVVSGTGFALSKVGAGTLQLDGANTFDGGVTDSVGIILADNNAALGTGTATIASGATLDLSGGITVANNLSITGAGVSPQGALVSIGGMNNTFSGPVTLTGATTLGAAAASTLTVSGAIGDGGGNYALTVDNAASGITVFSGNNTFGGLTTVSAGILEISSANALGATTNGTTVTGGATLEINGGITVTGETLTVNGAGVGSNGALLNLSGANTYAGSVTFGSNATIGATAGSLDLSGVVSGSGFALTKTGAGTLQLDGTNTFTGGVTDSAGILLADNNTALGTGTATIASGAALDLSGGITVANNLTISGTGSTAQGGLVSTGASNNTVSGTVTLAAASTIGATAGATLTLSGAIGDGGSGFGLTVGNAATGTTVFSGANAYAGSTTIAGGTLEILNSGTLGNGSGSTTVNSGATLAFGGSVNTRTALLTLNGAGVGGNGSLINISGSNSFAGPITLGANTTIGTTAGSLDLSGVIGGVGFGITKTGTGTLQLDGANTFSGGVTDSAGTVIATNSTALGSGNAAVSSGAALDLGGGITVANNLSLVGAGVTAQGALVSTGGMNNTESGNITLTGATTLGAAANSTLTLSGVIDDGANGYALTVDNASTGTTVLSGANTYGGGTTLSAGVVSVTNSSALGTGSVTDDSELDLSNNITVANNLTLNSTGNAVNNLSGVNTLSGTITLSSTATMVTASGSTLTISGAIGDGGSALGVTKTGAGILALTTSSTESYTGTTTVNAGELDLNGGSGNGLLSGPLVINGTSGSVTVKDLADNQVEQKPVTLNGSGATWDLNSHSDDVGLLTLTGGTVQTEAGQLSPYNTISTNASSSTATIAGNLDIHAVNPVVITVAQGTVPNGGPDLDITAVINGGGFTRSLSKGGAGTLELDGTNTYSGGTTISAGIVSITNSSALGTGAVTDNSELDLSNNISVANNIMLNSTGNAINNLSGINTYSGAITLASNASIEVTAGTLDASGVVSGSGFSLTKVGAGKLQLDGTNTFTGGVTDCTGTVIGNNSAALGTGNSTVANGAELDLSGGITVANNLSLAGAGISPQGALESIGGMNNTVSGTVTLTGATTLGAAANSTLTLSGAIGDGGGNYALTVNNAATGTTGFSGNNTYGGLTSVSAGILEITNANALGSTTNGTTVNSDATVEIAGGIATASEPLTLNGTGVGGAGALLNLSGTNTYAGTVTLASNASIGTTAGTLDLSGVVSGSGISLTTVGAGTLQLDGANTLTGGVTDSAGIVIATNSAALGTGNATVASGAALDLSGGITIANNLAISGTGSTAQGALVSTGATSNTVSGTVTLAAASTLGATAGSTLTLSGAVGDGGSGFGLTINNAATGTTIFSGANTYAGSTTVAGGTLELLNSGTLGNGSGSTTVNSGGTLAFGGSVNSTTALLTLNGAGVGGNGSLINISGNNTVSGPITLGSSTTIGTTAGSLDLSGVIGGVEFSITKAGTGALQLDGANTFSGGVTDTAGTVIVTNGSALGSGAVSVSSGAALDLSGGISVANDLSLVGAGVTAQGALISTGGISNTESGNITLTGATTLGAAANSTLTLSGTIDDGGHGYALSVNNASTGTTVFSGANAYGGGTTISAGIVSITNSSALGTGSVTDDSELDLSNNITVNNNITLNSTGNALNNLSGNNTLSGTIALSATATIVTASSSTLTISGGISGIGFGMTKTGAGILTLTASSGETYTGTTTVNAGELDLNGGGMALLVGPLVINGTSGSATVKNLASDPVNSQPVTLNGSGATWDLNGFSDSVGLLTLTGGTVTTESGTLTLTGGVTSNAAATTATISGNLDLGGSTQTFAVAQGTVPSGGADLSISAVTSNGGLTKTGAGTLELTGANSYSGGTTVSTGILAINNSQALGTGSVADNSEIDISNNLSLANNFTVDSVGTAFLVNGLSTIDGSVALQADTVVDTTDFSNLFLNGVVSGNAFGLTANGSGTVGLGQANTYGGGTTVNGGDLQVFDSQGTGTTGVVTVNSGATLVQSSSTYTLPSGGLSLGDSSTFLVPLPNTDTLNGTITLAGDPTFDIASNGSLTVNGAIGGSFGLAKSSAGQLILTATSTYTGITTVTGGTLEVDGDISASSEVDVNAGGTLGGSGTVGVVVSTGGTVAPADAPNILTTGGFSLDSNSTYAVQLDGSSPGGATGYDQVVASGAVSLGGAVLNATLGGSYTPTPGDQLTIIKNNSGSAVSGTFDGLAEGALFILGSFPFRVTYVGGLSGHDVVLTALEPTTTTVTGTQNAPVFGQSITFTAVVSAGAGTPTGTVTFEDDGTPLANGTVNVSTIGGQQEALYTISTLAVGDHIITAVYNPTGAFESSTGTLNPNPLVVGPVSTTTQVSSSSSPTSTYGQSVTFTVLVTSATNLVPAGSVNFFDGDPNSGGIELGSNAINNLGIATLSTSGLHVSGSPHSIIAVYVPDGSGDFLASSSSGSPFVQTVNPAPLTITANDATKVYGAALPTLSASYSGFVNGDTSASLATPPTVNTTATAGSHVAGSPYVITASGAADPDYTFIYVAGNLTVTPAPLTITANDATKVYGDALPALSASVSGFVNGDTSTNLDTEPTVVTTATAASHVAGSPYLITASGAADADYTISYVAGNLTVTPAPLTITANDFTKAYGDALPTFSANYSGFVNGDTSANLDTQPTLGTTATAASHVAGSPYAINASGAADTDYTVSYVAGSLTVTPAPLTIAVSDATKVYGDPLPTFSASFSGFVNGDTSFSLTIQPDFSTTATAASHVVDSPFAITASGAFDSDYSISYVAGSLTVTAAPLTITADDATKVYGDPLPSLSASFSGFVNGDTSASLDSLPTLNTTADAASHVAGSPYAITASGASDSDYTISYAPGNLTVTPAPLTITANDATKAYGDPLPVLSASLSGFVNGDTSANLTTQPTVSTAATAASHVQAGGYAITASGAVDTDYAISYVPGTLTVTPVGLTVTADNQTKSYGAALPVLTASFNGFVNGDTSASLATQPTLSTTATSASHVAGSPYAITASGAVDADYAISYVAGGLTVTPVALTVTANDQTKVYGAARPTLTASYNGFVNGDTSASLTTQPTLDTTATAASHVQAGGYPITASGAADNDYTISYVSGTLTVNPAPLTISADNQSKVYSAALPTLTATFIGLVNGDTSASLTTPPTLTTTATAASHVQAGGYVITASGAADSDYTISYLPGTLTVTAAPLVISAADQTMVYGSALPILTASFIGFVNGDTAASLTTPPTLGTTATSSSHVQAGGYPITASGAADPDYAISYLPGTLTVTPAGLTITADNQTKLYGVALPTLTASFNGFVNGDTSASLTTQPTLDTTATAASHVQAGGYAITASGAADPDYAINYVPGTQTVTPVALTITADNQTKSYGAALPALTASFNGFVNGDTSGSLNTQPTVTTTATASSHVNTYPINASGAVDGDYTISYDPGTLTVTPVALTITANDQTKVYGAPLPVLSASFNGFVNGDTSASLTTQPALNTTATGSSHVNSYSITASGAVDPDYAIGYLPGTLSVTQANLTIGADNQSKVYGAALPTLTASFIGLVNGDTSASLTTQPTLSTTATAASHVHAGGYAITASGAVDPDYAISYLPGTLNVTTAPLVISADNQSKVYGAALPPLSASFIGLVNGDTSASLTTPPSLDTNAITSSHVHAGGYAISASGAADSDYAISYIPGILTVTPASLTITANNESKVYGATLPAFSASFNGFVNGDTSASLSTQPTLSTMATAASHVQAGGYPITASGASDGDYSISYATGTLTVTPAPLTITADNQAKFFGAPIPTLTASYAGFVNGDTSANLMLQPTLTTTANASSPLGVYPINVSGAVSADYSITDQSGVLTVAKASSLITFATPGGTSIYGQLASFSVHVAPSGPSAVVPTGAVVFYVDGSPVSASLVDATGNATFNTSNLTAGAHGINAVYFGNSGYNPSLSSWIVQNVFQAATQSILTVQPYFSTGHRASGAGVFASVEIVAPGGGAAAGNVTFFANGRAIASAPVVNGNAGIFIAPRGVLNKNLSFLYSGDSNHTGSSSPTLHIGRNFFKTAKPAAAAFSQAHAASVRSHGRRG